MRAAIVTSPCVSKFRRGCGEVDGAFAAYYSERGAGASCGEKTPSEVKGTEMSAGSEALLMTTRAVEVDVARAKAQEEEFTTRSISLPRRQKIRPERRPMHQNTYRS
jgi:hypothetical protein